METSKSHRDGLMIIVIKFSICLLFCLLATRAVKAQTFKLALQAGTPAADPLRGSLLRNKVKHVYTSQIGVREKQVNARPELEKYLQSVGLGKGNPWCAAFVCWVYGQAGLSNPRSGWSPDLFPGSRTIFESGKLRRAESLPTDQAGGKLKAFGRKIGLPCPMLKAPSLGMYLAFTFPKRAGLPMVASLMAP